MPSDLDGPDSTPVSLDGQTTTIDGQSASDGQTALLDGQTALLDGQTAVTSPDREADEPDPLARPDSDTPGAETEGADVPARRRTEVVEPPHWSGSVAGGVEFGTLPNPVAAFEVAAAYQTGRFFASAGFHVALPATTTFAEAMASARLAWGAVRVSAGARLRFSRLQLELAGLAEAGVIGGRGAGIADPRTGFAPWVAFGLAASLAIRVGPIALGLGGDARVPLNRPAFALEGVGEAHRPSSIVGRAQFVITLHFL